MKKLAQVLVMGYMLTMAGACSQENEEKDVSTGEKTETLGAQKIKLCCEMAETVEAAAASKNTRANDYGYEKGDEIGIYVVNYGEGSLPGVLQNTGNYITNMRFTYTEAGLWKPDTEVYWKDNETKADFYAYYPYVGTSVAVKAYSFAVGTDQSTEQTYKAGDFLYGKTAGVAPQEEAVNITTRHLMSMVTVNVLPGNGFTKETLAAANVSVLFNGVQTAATLNLVDGTATATGSTASVKPYRPGSDLSYRLLLPPQSIAPTDALITVNVDGQDYRLSKTTEVTFKSGTRHTCSVTLNKISNGVNVGINPWEEDNIDYGGTAE